MSETQPKSILTTIQKRRIDAAMQEEMAKVTGGLQLPPGMKLPF